MSFHSLGFGVFVAMFFAVWFVVRGHSRLRWIWLIGASCAFYGAIHWWFVALLIGTVTLDFLIAIAIERRRHLGRALMIASCVSNLGVLATFKYANFFLEQVRFGLELLGVVVHSPVLNVALPIGISFYTFQSLSYVFDVYAGRLPAIRRLDHFLAIVTMFAHLPSGPIVRVSHILPQIVDLRRPSYGEIWIGLELIATGFFKKIVLADPLGALADRVFAESHPSGGLVWVGCVAFGFQIYGDFSGYTDIARGLARLIGIDFGENFRHPYTAVGIADFWRRWHISLSSWVRDYLYFPLGGSRLGESRTMFNVMTCFLVSGLWHGAQWTFIAWGAYHGALVCLERRLGVVRALPRGPAVRAAWAVGTFLVVSLGWIFFRAPSIAHAVVMFSSLTNFSGAVDALRAGGRLAMAAGGMCIALEAYHFAVRECKLPPIRVGAGLATVRMAAMVLCAMLVPHDSRPFVYFQF